MIFELKKEILEFKFILNEEAGFDWKTFKTLTNQKDILDYALPRLKQLGVGSSRAAFQLGKHVLKVARNAAGIGQNRAEESVYAKFPQTTAKIVASAPNGSWLLSERVNQFKSPEAFKGATGVPVDVFVSILTMMRTHEDWKRKYPSFANNKFLDSVYKLYLTGGLLTGDLEEFDHYGTTADGRVVLLDYGLTRTSVTHYKAPAAPKPDQDAATRKVAPKEAPASTEQQVDSTRKARPRKPLGQVG